MKTLLTSCLTLAVGVSSLSAQMVISAVFDGPLTGGVPKGVELYVTSPISDLSVYGLGTANNGGGSDGQEFTFPAVSASPGDYIYVASETTGFTAWFGFPPSYTSGAMSINGDDAVELFANGAVLDVFGDINTDGTNQPWEYLDGWAFRTSLAPNGGVWNVNDFTYSGRNALDTETSNATAANPVPVAQYPTAPLPVTLTSFTASPEAYGAKLEWQTASELNNDFFEVQLSDDGVSYRGVGRVSGSGSTDGVSNYVYSYDGNLGDVSYFRLRQVDYDGTEAFSHVAVVTGTGDNSLFVLGSAAEPEVRVRTVAGRTLTIVNLAGAVVQQLIAQDGLQTLDVSGLPSGMYLINDGQTTRRFVR